jgi:ATP-dependent RNA helicase DDX52/ROK1
MLLFVQSKHRAK